MFRAKTITTKQVYTKFEIKDEENNKIYAKVSDNKITIKPAYNSYDPDSFIFKNSNKETAKKVVRLLQEAVDL